MTPPNDKPPGFDPKDAAFAMNRADEMEHVQGIADGEVTAVSAAPGLLEGPPPVASSAPVRPPKPLPRWLPDALSLGSGVLALGCVLSLTGAALGEASRLPEGAFLDRLLGRAPPPVAGTPKLPQSIRETPAAAPRAPTEAEASSESYSGFGMVVDSTPEGARVLLDGQELGETPLALGSVECGWNEPLVVTVERSGWQPWSYEGACVADSMLTLKATLRR